MLFPLLSTLKVALLLQQQQRTVESVAVDKSSVSPTPILFEDINIHGQTWWTGTESLTESTVGQPTWSSTSLPVPTTNVGRRGCWRVGGRSFQMECCPLPQGSTLPSKASSPPAAPAIFTSAASARCRLEVDFAKLLECTQTAHFLLWAKEQPDCLTELLAEVRRGSSDAKAAEFSVSIGNWSGDSLATSELFNELHLLAVHSLELNPMPLGGADAGIQMPNLGLFFPQIHHLLIQPPANLPMQSRPVLNGRTFLRDLPMLKSLKVVNAEFGFDPKEEPQWLGQLERLHVENATFGPLPRWIAKSTKLERVFLLNSGLDSLVALSQLAHAVQIRVNDNHIQDLHRVLFKCFRLHELDLRRNGIAQLAPHSFARCHSLRLLDLSDNPFGPLMPEKPFLGCQRLKQLRLERIGLSHLRPEMFIGLANLKSLHLAGNPLARIDPFSFLPTRSIRSLSLANCSLTAIPLAVTQCCMLDSLSLDENRLAGRQSMPPEVLALLGRLSHFSFQQNPLLQLPRGLFLYEPVGEMQERKLADILTTLIHLPVWRLEPCTPYFWHFHLRNASSQELRLHVSSWNEERMAKEGLGHCQQLYHTILDGISIYRELLENSGCEASRRLRSVRASCRPGASRQKERGTEEEAAKDGISAEKPAPTVSSAGIVRFLLAPASILSSSAEDGKMNNLLMSQSSAPPANLIANPSSLPLPPAAERRASNFGLLQLSLGANICLLIVAILLAACKKTVENVANEVGRQRNQTPRREEFEEIY